MRSFIIVTVLLIQGFSGFGQGCSDAGFCTMGAMRPDQNYNKKVNFRLRSIEYNFYRGKTNFSPVILAHTIDLNATLTDLLSIHAKIPYQTVNGNLGSNSGLGDVSLSVTRFLKTVRKGEISATLGVKIPTGNSTQTLSPDDERHLPMYYQTTLGSFDLVGGASWISRDWLIATGVQVALTANGNRFLVSEWPNYPDQEYLSHYKQATELKRGTDVMIRVERNFRFLNWNLSMGLLPIYRITQDQIFFEETGQYVKLDRTTGLAMTALFGFGYQLNVRNGIRIIYGQKLTDRKVNPDGLTRENVLSFSAIHRF